MVRDQGQNYCGRNDKRTTGRDMLEISLRVSLNVGAKGDEKA